MTRHPESHPDLPPHPVPRRLTALALTVLLTALAIPAPAPAQLATYDIAVHVENILQTLKMAYAIYQRIQEIRHLHDQLQWMAAQLEGLDDPTKSRPAGSGDSLAARARRCWP